jgi:integrase
MQAYGTAWPGRILPRLGEVRLCEQSVGLRDRQLRATVADHGLATAKTCRSVLSGMCTLATRHNALPHNPVRDLGPLRGRPKRAPAAMTVAQLRQLRTALSYDAQAVARDLPDLGGFLMATGLRTGETCP